MGFVRSAMKKFKKDKIMRLYTNTLYFAIFRAIGIVVILSKMRTFSLVDIPKVFFKKKKRILHCKESRDCFLDRL